MSRTQQHVPHKSVATETGRELLAYVQHAAEQQCILIAENSQKECKAIVTGARRQSNQRVREAIMTARRAVAAKCEAERAHIRSRLRAIELGNTAGQLATLLPDVRKTLVGFWKDDGAGLQWVQNACALALHTIPAGTWHIEIAPGPSKATIQQMLVSALGEAGVKPILKINKEMDAGIRFRHDDVLLDASIDGLLAHPDRIEALYLGFLEMHKYPDNKHARK